MNDIFVHTSYAPIQVGPKSNSKQLHCLCTHLSAFGGDFLVAPNPIDFDKVFAEFGNLAESGNFVVLATVCGILGLYVIGLVFARREDKRDELRVSAAFIIFTYYRACSITKRSLSQVVLY